MDRTRDIEAETAETAETDRPEPGTGDERLDAAAGRGDDSGNEPALATADLVDARPPDPSATTDEPAAATAESPEDGSTGPLLEDERSAELRSRWEDVQIGFVDEPRAAVEQADGLVAEVLQDIARGFKTQRESLEKEWQVGDDVSTEDLRLALRRYRSFFDRLLSM